MLKRTYLAPGKSSLRASFVFAIALSRTIYADAVTSATGTFSPFPNNFSSSTPQWSSPLPMPGFSPSYFWNNCSYDSHGVSDQMNIGYLLADSGGFTGTSLLGSDSVAQAFTADAGADPAAFSFVRGAGSLNIGLLFADSTLDTGNASVGTVFGYYVGTTFTPLYTVGLTDSPDAAEAFNPTTFGNSYGFYATVCYAPGSCETYTTGNGNWGNNTGGAGWNHFALFKLASGNYAIGFEDANGIFGEGSGDYNDAVIEISTVVPEPSTFGLISLGITLLLISRAHR